jgi:hypothetical protein
MCYGQKVSFSLVGMYHGQKVSLSMAGMRCGPKISFSMAVLWSKQMFPQSWHFCG